MHLLCHWSSVLLVMRKPLPISVRRLHGLQHCHGGQGNDSGAGIYRPLSATSIAEYFMEAGRDVLIIYDDLTQHARTYRELSLLLRRPAWPRGISWGYLLHSLRCWSVQRT